MSTLRLGPLPKNETVRLTIALPAQVKADLDRYAQLYGETYGDAVDPAALAAHMITAFMERDRGFRRARQEPLASSDRSSPWSRNAATSSASDTASDGSSSR